ncbi:MAG: KilA-N domain-containing protein [SAR202 cluster bacterium]|nr:KilA-N domain-containing protein [SAR202 cluster bacterium]
MGESVAKKIDVQGNEIQIISRGADDFVSLTDIAKYRNREDPFAIINNWMRSRSTIEFLGLWEKLSNPDFKPLEFERFKSEAGSNYFVLSPQRWIHATNAIGIVSKAGRYGGTFAHTDIAFEFASWISSEFKLYLIKEFQRLKEDERKQLGWDIRRNLAKIDYRIHTDAIKENLVPPELTAFQTSLIYASEADVLNMALFGMTANQWRDSHPGDKGNIRDYANVSQLVCLSNLENLNALLIQEQMAQSDRLRKLNQIAIQQMRLLTENASVKGLEQGGE